MFTVIHFTDLNEVEVVPEEWVQGNICWYPNYKSTDKIKKAIRRRETPSSEYKKHNIKVYKSYDTYAAARAKLATAEYDSDLSSEAESIPISKRQTRKRSFVETQVKSEHENEPQLPHVPLSIQQDKLIMPPPSTSIHVPLTSTSTHPLSLSQRFANSVENHSHGEGSSHMAPPRFQTFSQQWPAFHYTSAPEFGNHGVQLPQSFNTHPFPNSAMPPKDAPPPGLMLNDPYGLAGAHLTAQEHPAQQRSGFETASTTQPCSNNEFETLMIRNFNYMKAQMKQLQESVDILVQRQTVNNFQEEATTAEITRFYIPVSSKENLDKLTEDLRSDVQRKNLIKKLGLNGGKDVRECTRRILASLMTDGIAERFSWLGSRGDKNSFSKSILKDIVIEAVRSNNKTQLANANEIENGIKEWLKNAKKRLAAESKKELSQQRNEEPHFENGESNPSSEDSDNER